MAKLTYHHENLDGLGKVKRFAQDTTVSAFWATVAVGILTALTGAESMNVALPVMGVTGATAVLGAIIDNMIKPVIVEITITGKYRVRKR